MSKSVTVNGKTYAWPSQPIVVICVDGCEPAYLTEAVRGGHMPWLKQMLPHGTDMVGEATMRKFGWQVEGLDNAESCAKDVTNRTGIKVHVGTLPHPAVKPGSLDAVTMPGDRMRQITRTPTVPPTHRPTSRTSDDPCRDNTAEAAAR